MSTDISTFCFLSPVLESIYSQSEWDVDYSVNWFIHGNGAGHIYSVNCLSIILKQVGF